MISTRTNMNAVSTARNLGYAQEKVDNSMMKLSTGLRINKAADDAAGLAISEKLKSQINGLNQASRNAKDAISLVQTAEGALGEIGNMLQRVRTLALQSVNDVNTVSERSSMQKEVSQLQTEITRLALASEFNGQKLLDGSFQSKRFQVGANSGQEIAVSIGGVDSAKLGVNRVASVGGSAASTSISAVTATNTSSSTTVNNVAAQTLTITGPGGTGTATIAAGDSAKKIAEAINLASGGTAVTAKAQTAVKLSGFQGIGGAGTGGAVSFTLGGDVKGGAAGVSTTVTAQVTDPSDLSKLAEAINEKASVTGIQARTGGTKAELILTSDDGRDIYIQDLSIDGDTVGGGGLNVTGQTIDTDGVGLRDAGAAATLVSGTNDSIRVGGFVSMESTSGVNVKTSAAGTLLANATENSSLQAVNSISVADIDGASAAIAVLDASIQQVSDLRASLGAIQNRLGSTVANLESSSENLQFSNSRVRDADVAMESSELARAQVLMQAGVSVLAQANQQPQMALKLLG
jgi:flagellin